MLVDGHGKTKKGAAPVSCVPTLGTLSVIGVSHHTAGLELRSKLSVPRERLNKLHQTIADSGASQCLVLSTCNRAEIYFAGTTPDIIVATLCRETGVDPEIFDNHSYYLHGLEAARHLFRVACGLESAALGETEILGQLKEASRIAGEGGHLCGVLHLLFRRAMNVSKKVRTETELCRNVTSLPSMAVRQASLIAGGLRGKRILLLGAGAIAERLAKELSGLPAMTCTVANRTAHKAQLLAQRYGFEFASLADIDRLIDAHDVVFCAVASDRPLIHKELLQSRELTVIDLGVPSIVEPTSFSKAHVVDLEFLTAACAANSELRTGAVAAAEAFIESELTEFTRACDERDVAPAITGLSNLAEHVRQENLGWAMANLDGLSPEQIKVVEDLSLRMMRGMLQAQIVAMKSESLTLEERACLSSVFRGIGPEAACH
jgi:glutamyl-tRNA reductase